LFSTTHVTQQVERIDPAKILFTCEGHFMGGSICQDITRVIYVEPQAYIDLPLSGKYDIARLVGTLNNYVSRDSGTRFEGEMPSAHSEPTILFGPGRWGTTTPSLGVPVRFHEISNTTVLVEIAYEGGNLMPELSFGTHFFQDLVESSIRYLPLYPDDHGVIFNEQFLTTSKSIFSEILPDYSNLAEVIRVIDVPSVTGGRVLQVLMNADKEQALGRLALPTKVVELEVKKARKHVYREVTDIHWRWRLQVAESIAELIDTNRFGVNAIYIFGSVNNATAGPESDIDLLIHFQGSETQRSELLLWLDAWNDALSEMNYQRTGYRVSSILDVHLVTGEEVRKRTGFASRIGAISDAARPLAVGKRKKIDDR